MNKKLLLLIPVLGIIGFSYYDKEGHLTKYHADDLDGFDINNYSANPPTAKTGAPGENNCTQCHSGTTQPAAGTVTYSFSGSGNEYAPGQSYTIDLSAGGVKNGFQMTVLDASNNAAGTFTAGTNSSTSSVGGKEYIYHSASSGVTDWSFTWNAPATDMGNLTVYYAYNRSDNGGTSASDVIYLGQETISISASASITQHEKLDASFEVIPNVDAQQLMVNYETLEHSHVELFVLDVTGKQLFKKSIGSQNPGLHNETIEYGVMPQRGIYFISIFINNEVLTRKIMI